MAENAQADIGLDYVWLDDVTYADWQRYHDLVRRTCRTEISPLHESELISIPPQGAKILPL